MRLTERDRQREREKADRRRQRVEEMNQILGMRNSLIITQTYGASVQLIHAYMQPPEELNEDHLILETLSDVEFDAMDLADSSAVVERCMAMSRTLRIMEPLIREDAINGFRDRLKELLAI